MQEVVAMKRFVAVIPILALLLGTGFAEAKNGEPAKESAPWLHVEVTEGGEKSAEVRVNVPLSLAELALEVAAREGDLDDHLDLDDHEISMTDLRRMWKELREAGDAEFVTVREDDETIRVYRQGDLIHVDIAEGEGSSVKVDLPVRVVDALLGGAGDELDVAAAIAEIQKMTRGDIVRIQDGTDTVRVWIE
jgi:hypothetical protein